MGCLGGEVKLSRGGRALCTDGTGTGLALRGTILRFEFELELAAGSGETPGGEVERR